MDTERQADIQSVVDQHGTKDVVVLLGATDVDLLALAAETVTTGDPSYAGPLAGVSLGLPVYHILEPALREEIPAPLYAQHLELISMVADVDGIGQILGQFRGASS